MFANLLLYSPVLSFVAFSMYAMCSVICACTILLLLIALRIYAVGTLTVTLGVLESSLREDSTTKVSCFPSFQMSRKSERFHMMMIIKC